MTVRHQGALCGASVDSSFNCLNMCSVENMPKSCLQSDCLHQQCEQDTHSYILLFLVAYDMSIQSSA